MRFPKYQIQYILLRLYLNIKRFRFDLIEIHNRSCHNRTPNRFCIMAKSQFEEWRKNGHLKWGNLEYCRYTFCHMNYRIKAHHFRDKLHMWIVDMEKPQCVLFLLGGVLVYTGYFSIGHINQSFPNHLLGFLLSILKHFECS